MDPTTVTNSGSPPARLNLAQASSRPSLRHRIEYYSALSLLKLLGALPHRLARAAGRNSGVSQLLVLAPPAQSGLVQFEAGFP